MNDQKSQPIFNLNFSQFFTGKYGWIKATIMIVSILLAMGYAAEHGAQVSLSIGLEARVSAIENTLSIPVNSSLSAFRKSNSYIVSLVDTYACLQNGTNGGLCEYSTTHSAIIQDGLNNASVSGGSVYVAEGSYSASVTLKNNTRLVIDRGATGITIMSVDASANCILDDFNNGIFKYYGSGALYSQFDYANGNLLIASANITTLYVKTIDSIDSTYVKILKMTVENGTSFPSSPIAGRVYYRTDLFTLYYWNSTNWVSCAGGGGGGGPDDDSAYLLSASATNFLFQNGTRSLTADWALGTYGIYQATFVNVTSLYCSSIDQLTSGSGVKILHLIVENGTSFPATPIEKQVFFRTDLGYLYVYNNSVWTPVGYTPNTYPYANLTGAPSTYPWANLTSVPVLLYANGSQGLTADWNIGGSNGIYGATWFNATSVNAVTYYLGNQTLSFVSQNTYLISISGSTYQAWYGTNSTLAFSGSNATQIINWALGNTTSGGIVSLGPGIFTYGTWGTSTLDSVVTGLNFTANNVTLQGAGRGTILRCAASTQVNCIYIEAPLTGETIRDLTIDGNWGSETDAGSDSNQNAIFLDGAQSCTIFNVYMTNNRVGYHCSGNLGTVSGTSGNSENELVWNCQASNMSVAGFKMHYSFGCRFFGNDVQNVTANGMSGFYLYQSSYNTLSQNTIERCGLGFYLNQNCSGNVVSSNIIKTYASGGGANGAVLVSASASTPNGPNTISDNQINAALYGIEASNYSPSQSIIGNDIIVSGNYGAIEVSGTNTNSCTVSHNQIRGATSYVIDITGSFHIVIGNAITGCSRAGVNLASALNCTVTGNTCQGSTDSGTFGSGIRLVSSNYTLVSVNTVVGNARYGIEVTDNSSALNFFFGNYIETNTLGYWLDPHNGTAALSDVWHDNVIGSTWTP